MDTWTRAHMFLYNIKEGQGYKTSVDNEVTCIKRTKKKIVLSNGVVVYIKKKNDNEYFHSAGFVRRYRRFEYVNQILRDIEGYLVYLIHNQGKLL
jgi:predicted N-acyltransferase